MAQGTNSVDNRSWALISGISLLLMTAAAGFSFGVVHTTVYVPANAEITALSLQHNQLLFVAGIAGWITIALLDVVVSAGVFRIYQSTSVGLATATALFRLIYTAVLAYAIFELVSIATTHDWQAGLSRIDQFLETWSAGLILFGVHLVLLGVVAARSTFTPRAISVLLVAAGVSYTIVEGAKTVFSFDLMQYAAANVVFSLCMIAGELLFAFWLIAWYRQARRTAN